MLNRSFGHLQLQEMVNADAYAHLDACLIARDKNGELRPRAEKGNKEISLARVILGNGVRTGKLASNPFDGVTKLKTKVSQRTVTQPRRVRAAKPVKT